MSTEINTGYIKYYNPNRGFGFIVYQERGEKYPQQIYFHINECVTGFIPEKDKKVKFDIMLNKKGEPMAVEVQNEVNS